MSCGGESGRQTRRKEAVTCKRCLRTDDFRIGTPLERLGDFPLPTVLLDIDVRVVEGVVEVDEDGNPV